MNRQEQARHSLALADRRARLSRLMEDAPEAILDVVEEAIKKNPAQLGTFLSANSSALAPATRSAPEGNGS